MTHRNRRSLLPLALVLSALGSLVAAAPAAAVELTQSRARAEINPVFRQELACANGNAVSAGLQKCRRRSTRIVDCGSVATLADDSGRSPCTKIYRAWRTSGGRVVVSQSNTGSDFQRYVRSRCRPAR